MKRLLAALLAVVLVCSMSFPAYAAEENKEQDVTAKYIVTATGECRAEIKNGTATADGVTVTGAPTNAKTLVVIPMEGEALTWVDGCVDGEAKAAYDIHFLDAQGNRINVSGVSVSVSVSGTDLVVSSVTPSGTDKSLSASVSGNTVSFTADGSHYYVIYQKDGGDQPGPGGDTVTVPIRGDENEIHADVTINDDTVELHELDFDEIDHIVGDHVNTGIVEIDLTELDEEITKIELPMASIKHIVEAAEEAHNDTEALQIDFPNGSVKLDDKTLRAIIDTVGEETTVDLVLESVGTDRLNDTQDAALDGQKIYGGYEAYLVCNNTGVRVSDFKGGVATLSVPFEIPNGLKAEKFAVWYVADDGTTEKLDTRYENEHLVWDVGHFSDFIIVYEGDETPITPGGAQTGDNSMIWLWVTIAVLSASMIFFLIFWKRRKQDEAKS
ncbi:MAG: hypothetical protein U0M06_10475 [Clostridia bacterium]|nr:hypothetical protein [Clostridia bacterium]